MIQIDRVSSLSDRITLFIYSLLRVVDSAICVLSLTLVDSDFASEWLFSREG